MALGIYETLDLLKQQDKRLCCLIEKVETDLSAEIATKITNIFGVPSFEANPLASLPAPGTAGRMYVSTDTYALYRDNGTGWDLIGGPGIGTVTGSGTATQVAFWNGSSVLSGSSNLYWDGSNNRLGVGTASPAHSIDTTGSIRVQTIANATTDTDKFLVSDSGVIKYRTGSEVLSDIGGASASSISGTTNYIPKFTSSSAIGNSNLQTDASGNLGLGVTPSAWGSGIKASQIGSTSSIYNISGETTITENAYIDASYNPIYLTNNYSTIYRQTAGQHRWFTAPSGTAGNAISFTQAMTLDASGNLLIGATGTAYAKVQINKSGAGFQDALILENTNTAAANLGTALTFAGVGSVSQTVIRSAWDGASTTDAYMSFLTRGSNTVTERMRITSGGDVLVATTTASYSAANRGNITIGGVSSSILAFQVNSVNKGYVYHDGVKIALWNVANGGMEFGTNDTERMRITSGGNVGIGTSSPAAKFEIVKTSTLRFDYSSNTGAMYMGDGSADMFLATQVSGAGNAPIGSYIYLKHSTNSVCIGTTSPLQTASGRTVTTVNGSSSSILNLGVNNSLVGYLYADASTTEVGSQAQLNLATGAYPIVVYTNSTERMRITSGGELLINTTSDAGDYKLQVNGNTLTSGSLTTAAPSGGTAKPWKLGGVISATVDVDYGAYVQVEIDGTAYKLALAVIP